MFPEGLEQDDTEYSIYEIVKQYDVLPTLEGVLHGKQTVCEQVQLLR